MCSALAFIAVAFTAVELCAAPAAAQDPAPEKPAASQTTNWRYFIAESDARTLFPILKRDAAGGTDVYDPVLFFRHRANLNSPEATDELPEKLWHMRTNSLGLRMDRELEEGVPDLRVLLTGDANVEGVCDNSSTIASLLENQLHAAHAGLRVEVINAAKGSYCFYNYRGVIERFAELRPKVFVIVVFWNDFEEALHYEHFFAKTKFPQFDAEGWRKVHAAKQVHADCLAQGMYSYAYFKQFPAELDLAQDVAARLIGEIAARCAVYGIEPVVVWSPPPYDLDPAACEAELGGAMKELELTRDDLSLSVRAAERFLQTVRALRIVTYDLRAAYATEKARVYTRSDQHLNTLGNQVVARELAPLVEVLTQPRQDKDKR